MKSRFAQFAVALLLPLSLFTIIAAENFREAPDKFRQRHRSANIEPGGETPAATIARGLVGSPTGTIQILDKSTQEFRDLTGADLHAEPFVATATITSAAAATAVNILPESRVPAGRKVYVTGFHAKVNGATNWATTATVKIQDTNGTPVDFFTAAVAALTGNAEVRPGTSNVTSEDAYRLGTGGTAAKGLQLKGNANGTGSNLVVTVYGIIK